MRRYYDLKKEDLCKYDLRIIITDKRVEIGLRHNKKDKEWANTINLDSIELPPSKFFDKERFPNKLIEWIDEFDDNAIKAIRNRNKQTAHGAPFIAFLRENGYKFIIDFLPMYKRTLNRQWQEQFKFRTFEEFENKIYDLLENAMKIQVREKYEDKNSNSK